MKTFVVFLVIIALVGVGVWYWQEQSSKSVTNVGNTMKNSEMLEPSSGVTVKTSDVNYFATTKGFLAQPQEEGSYPGVVMIHEWWGLNDNIKDTARQLASQGYNVLAVDLYRGEMATTSTKAMQLVQGLNQEEALRNMKAAKEFLQGQMHSTKIASLGWCFGGGQSLQLALSGEKLDATVIYYGNLVTDAEKLKVIEWPVLGVFGDKDQSISVESVKSFEAALNQDQIKNSIHIYPGVGHAFANPSGQNYAPNETKDAWAKTLAFLKENLK